MKTYRQPASRRKAKRRPVRPGSRADAFRTAQALRNLGLDGGVAVIARELLDLWEGM